MTDNFEFFVFSVFKTDSLLLQDIKKNCRSVPRKFCVR